MTKPTFNSRRHFLKTSAALAAAPLMGATPVWAAGQTPVTLGLGWVPNVQYAGHWLALEKGYFADEGIESLEIPGGPNAPNTLVSLASGSADIVHSNWLSLLDARDKGNDFKMFAANFPVSPLGIMSMAGKPILKPEDLVGARILTQVANDKTVIDTILELNGLPKEYTIVPAGFSPEPLLAGDGDAYFCFVVNQPITFENMGLKKGEDFHVVTMAELGYYQPGAAFTASTSYLEENRELMVKYLRAEMRGWLANDADPSLAAKLVVEKYGADLGLSVEQQTRQNELQIPLTLSEDGKLFWIDPELVAGKMYDIARLAGRNNLPEDPSEVVDMSILEEALSTI
ncbi:ABC transporter substrate-binding protein [Ruegeria hyattellae]|uniref:ABC transporter substrate-binding protein n=1 Tax=Ruegeria hyattellae TaxID=3233337 RepID=UPI00355AFFE1